MRDEELQLNRIAQGLVNEDAGVLWFEALAMEERVKILQYLSAMISQAHPRTDDVALAIARSRLKPTYTPCVMLQTAETPTHALSRIALLPESEQLKSFRLLMALFSVADARRRETMCKSGCTHEWHNLKAL